MGADHQTRDLEGFVLGITPQPRILSATNTSTNFFSPPHPLDMKQLPHRVEVLNEGYLPTIYSLQAQGSWNILFSQGLVYMERCPGHIVLALVLQQHHPAQVTLLYKNLGLYSVLRVLALPNSLISLSLVIQRDSQTTAKTQPLLTLPQQLQEKGDLSHTRREAMGGPMPFIAERDRWGDQLDNRERVGFIECTTALPNHPPPQ